MNKGRTPNAEYSMIRREIAGMISDVPLGGEAREMLLDKQPYAVYHVLSSFNGNRKEAAGAIAKGAQAVEERLKAGHRIDIGNGYSFPMEYTMAEMALCAEAGARNPEGIEVITSCMRKGMIKNGQIDSIALDAGLVDRGALPSSDTLLHGCDYGLER